MGADAVEQGEARLRLLAEGRQDRILRIERALATVRQCASWLELRHLLHQESLLSTALAGELAYNDAAEPVLRFDISALLRGAREIGIDQAVERTRRAVTRIQLEAESGKPRMTLDRDSMDAMGLGAEAD